MNVPLFLICRYEPYFFGCIVITIVVCLNTFFYSFFYKASYIAISFSINIFKVIFTVCDVCFILPGAI